MPLKYPDTVNFDPSNEMHRAAVAAFLKRRAWSDSPIRFTHDPAYGSLADQVKTKLLHYYLSKDQLPNIEVPQKKFVGCVVDNTLS